MAGPLPVERVAPRRVRSVQRRVWRDAREVVAKHEGPRVVEQDPLRAARPTVDARAVTKSVVARGSVAHGKPMNGSVRASDWTAGVREGGMHVWWSAPAGFEGNVTDGAFDAYGVPGLMTGRSTWGRSSDVGVQFKLGVAPVLVASGCGIVSHVLSAADWKNSGLPPTVASHNAALEEAARIAAYDVFARQVIDETSGLSARRRDRVTGRDEMPGVVEQ